MRRPYAYAANDSTLSLFLRSLHAFLALVLSNHAKLRVVQFRQWRLWGGQNTHARARNLQETRREGSAQKIFRASFVLRLLEISRARVCISPGPQSPSPSQSKIKLAFPTISEPGTG